MGTKRKPQFGGQQRNQWRHWRGLLLFLFAGMIGCTQAPLKPAPAELLGGIDPRQSHPDRYWWRACFRMPFDRDGKPLWSMDLLLADLVAGPVISQYATELPLWRFHRRAAHDGAGHQFSLLFYSDAGTAERLFAELQSSPMIAQLIGSGKLDHLIVPCGGAPKPELEATSDPEWDIRLQKTWPYFIMGVSAHWLALIDEVGAEIPAQSDSLEDLLVRYGKIHAEISLIWREQGQHAYLHHLNALFGYEPMLIQKIIRF